MRLMESVLREGEKAEEYHIPFNMQNNSSPNLFHMKIFSNKMSNCVAGTKTDQSKGSYILNAINILQSQVNTNENYFQY